MRYKISLQVILGWYGKVNRSGCRVSSISKVMDGEGVIGRFVVIYEYHIKRGAILPAIESPPVDAAPYWEQC